MEEMKVEQAQMKALPKVRMFESLLKQYCNIISLGDFDGNDSELRFETTLDHCNDDDVGAAALRNQRCKKDLPLQQWSLV